MNEFDYRRDFLRHVEATTADRLTRGIRAMEEGDNRAHELWLTATAYWIRVSGTVCRALEADDAALQAESSGRPQARAEGGRD